MNAAVFTVEAGRLSVGPIDSECWGWHQDLFCWVMWWMRIRAEASCFTLHWRSSWLHSSRPPTAWLKLLWCWSLCYLTLRRPNSNNADASAYHWNALNLLFLQRERCWALGGSPALSIRTPRPSQGPREGGQPSRRQSVKPFSAASDLGPLHFTNNLERNLLSEGSLNFNTDF